MNNHEVILRILEQVKLDWSLLDVTIYKNHNSYTFNTKQVAENETYINMSMFPFSVDQRIIIKIQHSKQKVQNKYKNLCFKVYDLKLQPQANTVA